MVFQKYLGDSKMFEYDKYYRECQQQNKPFIKAKINPAHGNYFVQIDLITCDYKLSKDDKIQIEKFIRDEIEYIKSHLKYDFHGYHITKELAWFDGISSPHLDSFCNFLYDLTRV
ncbi:hypothetical protein [Nitrosopumilus sp.]|uniref:hypothetical protein n=1 Tax=Nitrosopumilus sp. TaxID=2024843 RepID=UPI00247CACDA|nr:hypothetical protein [Nitrosopumilus sp.]MCV0429962.1 hypothetical protein [Nitrosopumilus sp.]